MFEALPGSAIPCLEWPWEQFESYYQALLAHPLDSGCVEGWLLDWTRLADLIGEVYARLSVAVTLDTTDPDAERRFNAFLDRVHPQALAVDQQLKEKLLASGLEPVGFSVPLRKMRAEAALFRHWHPDGDLGR
jgi:oligoendopeptidase F